MLTFLSPRSLKSISYSFTPVFSDMSRTMSRHPAFRRGVDHSEQSPLFFPEGGPFVAVGNFRKPCHEPACLFDPAGFDFPDDHAVEADSGFDMPYHGPDPTDDAVLLHSLDASNNFRFRNAHNRGYSRIRFRVNRQGPPVGPPRSFCRLSPGLRETLL